jgi:hypothetical protein
MSDEHTPEDELAPQLEVQVEEIEDEEAAEVEDLEAQDEWEEDEEVSPEEVESVVRKLDSVIETVESDTVHAILMEAYERIEELVDWEDEGEGTVAEAA